MFGEDGSSQNWWQPYHRLNSKASRDGMIVVFVQSAFFPEGIALVVAHCDLIAIATKNCAYAFTL